MKLQTAIIGGLIGLFSLIVVANVQAGDNGLEVSADSSFSSQTINFSAGQTIYVRTTAENDGADKRQLNLRDNQYNVLKSYTLSKDGSTFSASLSAPSSEGYYSLEARIESADSVNTSVKTIKVGNPQNANVKVSIKENKSPVSESNDDGEAVLGEGENQDQSIAISPSPEVSPSPQVFEEEPEKSNFWTPVFNFVLKIADFLWPF